MVLVRGMFLARVSVYINVSELTFQPSIFPQFLHHFLSIPPPPAEAILSTRHHGTPCLAPLEAASYFGKPRTWDMGGTLSPKVAYTDFIRLYRFQRQPGATLPVPKNSSPTSSPPVSTGNTPSYGLQTSRCIFPLLRASVRFRYTVGQSNLHTSIISF